MTNRLLVFALCCLLFQQGFTQSSQIDSLKAILNSSLPDNNRLENLAKISKLLIDASPAEAANFGRKTLELAIKKNDLFYQSKALLILSECAINQGQIEEAKEKIAEARKIDARNEYANEVDIMIGVGNLAFATNQLDSAHFYFQKSLTTARQTPNKEQELTALINLGSISGYLSEVEKSEQYYKEALIIAEAEGYSDQLPLILRSLGSIHGKRGDYETALPLLYQSLELYEEQGDNVGTITTLSFLILLHNIQNKAKEAIALSEKTIAISEKHNLKSPSVVIILGNLAVRNHDNGDLGVAFKYATKAVNMARELQDTGPLSIVLPNLAAVLEDQGKSEEAFQLSQEALALAAESPNPAHKSNTYMHVAEQFLKRNQPQDALNVLNNTLTEIHQLQDLHLTKEYYRLLFRAYFELDNTEKALETHQTYKMWSDSVQQNASKQQLQITQTKYETEKKEQENQFLKANNTLITQQKNGFLMAAIALLIFLLGMIYLYFQIKNARQKIAKQNEQLGRLNETKDRLFAIISHDLRSEISAFKSVGKIVKFHLKKGNYDRLNLIVNQVDQSTESLNNLLDNLLQWSVSQLDSEGISIHSEALSLREEAEKITDLFAAHAQTKGIQLRNEIAEELKVMADENSLQLIFRNLVSNALKFTPNEGEIILKAQKDNDQIQISVTDTGMGIPENKLAKVFQLDRKNSSKGTAGERGIGLGLALCKEFVERNGGQIQIQSEIGNGTICQFTLPCG